MHRQKQGHVVWMYRDAVQKCRDGIKKAKARIELILARDAETIKKGFYRHDTLVRKERPRRVYSL